MTSFVFNDNLIEINNICDELQSFVVIVSNDFTDTTGRAEKVL